MSWVVVATLGGCDGAPGPDRPAPGLPAEVVPEVDTNRRLVGEELGPGVAAAVFRHDWSGEVTAAIWECTSSTAQSHQALQCSVDPDFVLVGGGARTFSGTFGAGAFLTASYPADTTGSPRLTRWEGRSKDHGVYDPHELKVYAIGLKLFGVSRADLAANVFVNVVTSPSAHHPQIGAPPREPSGCCLDLGGGARVNWTGAGNLLTTSWAEAAQGKDHLYSDEATITHYRIMIHRMISGPGQPLWGSLEQAWAGNAVTVEGGPATPTVLVPIDWVPVSIGVITSWTAGRLLTALSPSTGTTATGFIATTKEHLTPPDGGTTMLMVGILRKAWPFRQ